MKNEINILIVDDTPSIHEDYKQILNPQLHKTNLYEFSDIFDIKPANTKIPDTPTYILDHAYQGEEAIELVKQSKANNKPYALAFIDVCMPPGLDGIETISKIWEIDKNIEIIICTAFSNYSWESIIDKLGITNNFMILKKPFDIIEVKQMTLSLTSKWQLSCENKEFINQIKKNQTELNKARLVAEENSKIKSDFISIISHELKTPLTAILGYTDLLISNAKDTNNLNQICQCDCNAIRRIDINAHKLNDLIKDILLISNIESGTINCNIAFFYPQQTIERIVDGFKNLIENKHLTIKNHIKNEDIYINSDRVKFETIVTNIISNAIKFTKNGSIDIECNIDEKFFYVSIRDTGIGIPKDKFNIIFENFRQVDQKLTRDYTGTGIGLAIAMRMAQLLGGGIKLESQEGVGSIFTLYLKRDLDNCHQTTKAYND